MKGNLPAFFGFFKLEGSAGLQKFSKFPTEIKIFNYLGNLFAVLSVKFAAYIGEKYRIFRRVIGQVANDFDKSSFQVFQSVNICQAGRCCLVVTQIFLAKYWGW